MVNLGYCCINLSLKDENISVNRGMVKKTFQSRGPAYAGELALKNIEDLLTVLLWNQQNRINVYRMSSDMFPWMSEYKITELPNFDKIRTALEVAGQFAKLSKMRLSFHPGPFNVLGSPNDDAVTKTIHELDRHAEIMDIMGLELSHRHPINIHIGGAYGDKEATTEKFAKNFRRLSDSTRARLVVENDDKLSLYTVEDLAKVYVLCGTPITFDYHHHWLHPGNQTVKEAFILAKLSWRQTPLFHYSSNRKLHEDPACPKTAHADYVYEKIDAFGLDVDIELETKMKDLALLKYRDDFGIIE